MADALRFQREKRAASAPKVAHGVSSYWFAPSVVFGGLDLSHAKMRTRR